tara:strand:+ start:100 stop:324 length:225 start_codon:yes stop_codon:yes gene_type:complete
MDLEFFILGGYGQFVWSAFIFTFVSCLILYIKTKKELQKQEKMFLKEYEKQLIAQIKTTKEKKITKEALSGSSI